LEVFAVSEFWKLISVLLCLAGFLITGGGLLLQGTSFVEATVKATIALIVLYVLLRIVGSILVSMADHLPSADEEKEPQA
jgi:hypothetical protein